MISAKSYAKAYLTTTNSLEPAERIGWLLVFKDRHIQRSLKRLLQQRSAADKLVALQVPASIAHFLAVLAEDRRLNLLGSVAQQGLRLAYERGLGTPVILSTAAELSAEQIESLGSQLGTSVPTPVVIEAETNPALLGGFRIDLGGQQLDQSLISRLASFRAHLRRN